MTDRAVWQAIALVGALAGLAGCGGGDGDPAGALHASGGAGSVSSFGGAGSGGSGGSGGAAGAGGTTASPGGSAGADSGADACPRFVTAAIDHAFGPGQDTGQVLFPKPILGPPKGGGCCQGSLDVVSLGNGGFVSVEFGGTTIVDAPGPDFIVFENAFDIGGDPNSPFAELATVAVSDDGKTWHEFPCTATSFPYGSCAGWHPVFANPDENQIDPLDPSVAGGDAFDLADLGLASARYVRITDRVDTVGVNGVFDLDAVGIVHAECP